LESEAVERFEVRARLRGEDRLSDAEACDEAHLGESFECSRARIPRPSGMFQAG
jgi:hypothetical protein